MDKSSADLDLDLGSMLASIITSVFPSRMSCLSMPSKRMLIRPASCQSVQA
jgi:hypothetical protein